jgi:hypothetical protein
MSIQVAALENRIHFMTAKKRINILSDCQVTQLDYFHWTLFVKIATSGQLAGWRLFTLNFNNANCCILTNFIILLSQP